MKVAIVTPAIHDTERLFGAERHFVGLVQAFKEKVDTDWLQVPVSEACWQSVLEGYLDCHDLDLASYSAVFSTKTPTYMAQHRNHVCWLLHQMRVFYDRFGDEYGTLSPWALAEQHSRREMIQRLDDFAFARVRKIFTNGCETARRLKLYNGFEAEVLYPPALVQGHYSRSQEYFFLPGRLHRWKRVDLAIRAMQLLPYDVPLLIAGTGSDEGLFRELAGDDPRIRFLGFVGDEEMLELYANALAVLFVPKEEDFGYITVEAMLSHKPVIVCNDSGEPTRLVQNGRTGFIVNPDPAEIAGAMALLAGRLELAREMGERAFEAAPSQSWEPVVERLLGAAVGGSRSTVAVASEPVTLPPLLQKTREAIQVLVTDNQVLEPAVGGGRVRVKELCRGLAAHFPTEYIGAYDWYGPKSTDDWPLPAWHSRVFALSWLQYKLARALQRFVPGGSVIDVGFPWMTRLSPEFVRALHQTVASSEVVVFTHPWVYPLAGDLLKDKLVIYDAHNFEFALRSRLLSSTFAGRKLASSVGRVEGELVRRSNDIWVCSSEDADAMSKTYGVARGRFHVLPNCADTNAIRPPQASEKAAAKAAHGWEDRDVAIFVGSGYRPNTEAAAFIIEQLAPKFPDMIFAVAGSVKEDYFRTADPAAVPENARLLGVIAENELASVFAASDFGLNPVEVGSGTNLKLVQYMAAGLAIVSTETGVRGIEGADEFCAVADRGGFADALKRLRQDEALRTRCARLARRQAEDNYDWRRALDRAAYRINGLLRYRRRMSPPFFSVVIPTYNRNDLLLRNLNALTLQTFPDFEVVVVDQSDPPVTIPDEYKRKLEIRYVYSNERGPALARNKGIQEATGLVVAFTDDDCIPQPDWLEKAARYFDEAPRAGLEGCIRTDDVDPELFRTVTNVGFEGFGFMTANMFYRRDLLSRVQGFDECFKDFREDTDLAWRIIEFGEIPYARDVVVFHPPHPVTVERESRAERAKMFRLDPILLERHPDKYMALLRQEGHYRKTPGFWQHFVRGMEEFNARPPIARFFQHLRFHDPDWWNLVTSGNGAQPGGGLTAEDLAALHSLLGNEHLEAQVKALDANAE
ncbi:MAG TPA: glycosyltransferase [Terriglobales bacterium]|nr:glycosyltransferase [Terriglobales bacterium]